MNPEKMSRQELEELFDAAVDDPNLFRAVTSDPELWRALREIGRERKRAAYGKWHRVVWPFEWTFIWLLRIITAPFRGRV